MYLFSGILMQWLQNAFFLKMQTGSKAAQVLYSVFTPKDLLLWAKVEGCDIENGQ
jgi:hypothetical protein